MSVKPLPTNLSQTLPDQRTPWHTSPKVFSRLQFHPSQTDPYTKCEITKDDPEYKFVATYFEHDAPTNRTIRRIFCIHNPSSTGQFETKIPNMEQESTNPNFAPTWHKEDHLPLREKAFGRWQDSTEPFSPFFITSSTGRKDIYKNVKIVPLWHGSTEAKCNSVCQTGFTFFGKHGPKDAASTDIGFFGSGIYFTNSARYAADIYSDGHLLLAWVSMREPFPVVSDKAVLPPEEPKDMRLLKGKGAYKNYNAHYVPVISINPAQKECAIYYPCAEGQAPMCDEYAIFQPAQTLARFWVELDVTLLYNPSVAGPAAAASITTVEHMLKHLLDLLEHESIAGSDVAILLENKTDFLFTLDQKSVLAPKELEFYNCAKNLLTEAGKIRGVVQKKLLQCLPSPPQTPAQPSQPAAPLSLAPVAAALPKPAPQPQAKPVAPVKAAQPVASALPAMAFGALKWQQYFGLQVVEPSLPPDIDKILASKSPFWPGKTVAETHFLTLIPEGLTLERLEALVQNSKQGNKIAFRSKDETTWAQHRQTPAGKTHWALMTNDIIPGSRDKNWKDQQALAAQYKGNGYELLSGIEAATCLFLEYVQTGQRFYADSPWTWTRCIEQVKSGSSQWPLAIGGFAPAGPGCRLRRRLLRRGGREEILLGTRDLKIWLSGERQKYLKQQKRTSI